MPDLWLAVTDETGNFDKGNGYIGVGLVVARVRDWSRALREPIGRKTVAETLTQPIPIPRRRPPSGAQRLHVRDAFQYWNARPPREPLWKQPGLQWNDQSGDEVARYLAPLLAWLMANQHLITLGVIGRAPHCRQRFRLGSRDPAHLLARMTAPLVELVWPFLGTRDRLCVLPSFRSEPATQEANRRVQTQRNNAGQERIGRIGDRPLVSTLLDQVYRTSRYFPVNTDRCHAGRSYHLHQQCAGQFDAIRLSDLQPVADIAAALALMTHPVAHHQQHLRLPRPSGTNARFFDIDDVA